MTAYGRLLDNFTWQYLLAAVIAVPIVLAITGRPRDRQAIAGRVLTWAVTVGLLMASLRLIPVIGGLGKWFLEVGRLATMGNPRRIGGIDQSRDLAEGTFLLMSGWTQLLALVAGLGLAAVLWRRIRWPFVEEMTGWNLGGWRRWALWALAGSYFSWPIGWLVAGMMMPVLSAFSAGGPFGSLSVLLPTMVIGGAVIVVVLWSLRRFIPIGDQRTDPTASGLLVDSAVARWLFLVGLVGFASAGLMSVTITLVSQSVWLFATDLPDEVKTISAGWILTLAITLAPLLAIPRVDWQPPAVLTGGPWTRPMRVLAALTIGGLLTWPVRFAENVAIDSRDPVLVTAFTRLVGAVFLAAAVLWLLRYRPTPASDD